MIGYTKATNISLMRVFPNDRDPLKRRYFLAIISAVRSESFNSMSGPLPASQPYHAPFLSYVSLFTVLSALAYSSYFIPNHLGSGLGEIQEAGDNHALNKSVLPYVLGGSSRNSLTAILFCLLHYLTDMPLPCKQILSLRGKEV